MSFSESKMMCCVSVPNPCVYMYAYQRPCTFHVVHIYQSLVDYGNMNITSTHLYPQRQNVAAEVAKELKMVTYATPPNGGVERRKEKKMFRLR